MTRLLERAFTEASKLTVVEQNARAQWVMEELESENKWANAFDMAKAPFGHASVGI